MSVEQARLPTQTRSAAPHWARGWPLWFALAGLFGAYQGINALIGLRGSNPAIASWKPFVWETSSIVVIVALVPAIVRLESHFRLDARPRTRIVLLHVAGAVLFSIVHTASMVAIRKLVYLLVGATYVFGNVFLGAFYEFQKDAITYAGVLLVAFAIREAKVRRAGELRAAELAAEVSEARLRHLTAQIEPHFLFNSLNAISNRMHEDVEAADRMIAHLGDLLRAAYACDQQLLVPLASELEWLRGYATMMAERFRGQLTFDLDVEPGLESLAVPRLLLQPIVENAFRHGLGDGRGSLWVRVQRKGDRVRYTVSDDGAGLRDEPVTHGTGLSNVARRLELLFQDDYELSFAPRVPHGTVFTIVFPVTR